MQLLKQSTAFTVYVGPVLDSAGAAVTTAVLGDFRLVKNGTAATLTGATVTHDANGYYTVALTTTNTNTVGALTVGVGNTAMAMATHNYIVLLPSVYDAIITNATNATGGLPTATGAISAFAGAISTYAGGAVASVTGNVGGNVVGSVGSVSGNVSGSVASVVGNVGGNVVGSVGSVTAGVTVGTGGISTGSFAAGAIDAGAIATDAIGSAEISAAAVTKIQNGLATPTNITAGTLTTVTNLTNLPSIPANWLTAAGIAASALNGKGDWSTTGAPMTLTAGERNSIADTTLGRSAANSESTAAEWSLASLILAAFEYSISGTTWTIKRTDGTTVHLTKTVATNAAADPIVGVN